MNTTSLPSIEELERRLGPDVVALLRAEAPAKAMNCIRQRIMYDVGARGVPADGVSEEAQLHFLVEQQRELNVAVVEQYIRSVTAEAEELGLFPEIFDLTELESLSIERVKFERKHGASLHKLLPEDSFQQLRAYLAEAFAMSPEQLRDFSKLWASYGRLYIDEVESQGTGMIDWSELWRRTAYHEAGHAVAAFNLGQWQIGPGGLEIDDHRVCNVRYPACDAKSIWHHGLFNCAGWVAECKRAGRPLLRDDDDLLDDLEDVRTFSDAGDRYDDPDDYKTLKLILVHNPDATDAEVLAVYRKHEQRAVDLLSDPVQWAAVERIAAALGENGRLSAEEVTAIYDGVKVGRVRVFSPSELRQWLLDHKVPGAEEAVAQVPVAEGG